MEIGNSTNGFAPFIFGAKDSIDNKLRRTETIYWFCRYKLNNAVDRYWILTLRLKQERRHHAILLANLVDIGFAPVHVFHVARLFQTNASSVAQVYLGVVLSMNLPYWRALAAVYWFWLNVHLRKLRNTKSKQLKQLKCWTK